MADKTKIEWSDATWNPITGCSVISPGCQRCYAMKLAGGRLRNHPSRQGLTVQTKVGPVWNGQVRFNQEWLDQPLKWRRPRQIFVCAHGDLFHENVPDEWVDRVFNVMAKAHFMQRGHVFQVLTKRAERMALYMMKNRLTLKHWPLPNVWLGVSVEDQKRADERIPLLLDTSAAVRWISAEPLLSEIDLYRGGFSFLERMKSPNGKRYNRLDWCVVGGESGHGYRPMDPSWARMLREQCAAAGVPFFMKQMAGKKPIPEDLLIREYPIGGRPHTR